MKPAGGLSFPFGLRLLLLPLLLAISDSAWGALDKAALDALFDDNARKPSALEGALAVDLRRRMEVVNGQLRRFDASYVHWGTTLEAGYLGLDSSRNGLMALSPYLNLRQEFESRPRSWVDYRLRFAAGVADLAGTYLGGAPPEDPELAALASRLGALAGKDGISAADARGLLAYAQYSDPLRTTRIALASVLAQVGRAYGLYGPLDLGWTLSGLVKLAHLFPNAALDASAGPRLDLGKDRGIGLYGGVTHNLSPLGNRLLQDLFGPGGTAGGVHGETAPHLTAAYAGSLPGWPELLADLKATRQWNADTVADQLRAALRTVMGGKPTEISAAVLAEKGPAIEFARTRACAELTCRFSDSVTGGLGYRRENIRYGDASVAGETVYSTVQLRFGPGDHGADWEIRSGGKDALAAPPLKGFERVAAALNQALGEAFGVAESAQLLLETLRLTSLGDLGPTKTAAQDLSRRVHDMDPETRQALRDTLLSYDTTPAQRRFLDDLFSGKSADQLARDLEQADGLEALRGKLAAVDLKPVLGQLEEIRKLLALISSDGMMEKLAVRVGRNRLLDALDRTDQPVPQLHTRFRWSPAVLFAAGAILSSRPSPVAPLSAADARDRIEPWLWRGLAQNLGMQESATPEQVTAELLARLGRGIQEELRKRLGSRLEERFSRLTPEEAAGELQRNLPASTLEKLRARYGRDLSGLLTPGRTGKDVLDAALDGIVSDFLRDHLGPVADQGAAALASWLGQLIRRELNAMLIQVLLASEQLDQLSADRGRKSAELGVDMLQDSFGKLERRRGRLRRVLQDAASLLDSPSQKGGQPPFHL